MGGSSKVIAGDTREEVIEKAREWYRKALGYGLFPRRFVYEPSMVIEFQHCEIDYCPYCGGEPMKAYLTTADIEERPEDAESKPPFGIFSDCLTEEKRSKRFFGFVSAHS